MRSNKSVLARRYSRATIAVVFLFLAAGTMKAGDGKSSEASTKPRELFHSHPLYRDTSPWPTSVELFGEIFSVTQGATVGYVPDKLCHRCHIGQSVTFPEVGMAKAFYRPTSENILEDYENNHFHHLASDTHYEMARRDGAFFQRQYKVDEQGRRFAESERRVDWILGSGGHVRTYLHATPGGELFQLPLAWYSQVKRWGMNPGYDNPAHQGVTRRIERECIFCHNAYPDIPAGSDALEEPPLFPTNLPEGIGCQRCHGPGAKHIRIATQPVASLQELRESIVNPATLVPRLRDDVCLQCHLQPNLTPTSFIRRFGRGEFSFRAGEPLDEYLLFVDYDEPPGASERFEINHHPYRLHQSACFQKSAGQMNCMTCHDPHRKVPPEARSSHYRARCLTCHKEETCRHCVETAGEHQPGTEHDCVSCHMPQRRTQDVVLVSMTDHKIVKRAIPIEGTAPLKETHRPVVFPPRPYWSDREPPSPELSLYMESLMSLGDVANRTSEFETAILRVQPASVEPLFYLAQQQLKSGRFRESVSTYRDIVRRSPQRGAGWRGLGHALASSGEFREGVDALNKAIAGTANVAHYHYLLGSVLAASGRGDEGVRELRRALELRPMHVSASADLSDIWASQGRIQEAAEAMEKAVAAMPGQIENVVGLAALHIYLDHGAKSVTMLESERKNHADDAALKLALACSLVSTGSWERASELASDPKVLALDESTSRLVLAAAQLGRADPSKARIEFSLAQEANSKPTPYATLRAVMFEKVQARFSASTRP